MFFGLFLVLSEQLQAYKQAVIKHTQAKDELSVSLKEKTAAEKVTQGCQTVGEKQNNLIANLISYISVCNVCQTRLVLQNSVSRVERLWSIHVVLHVFPPLTPVAFFPR